MEAAESFGFGGYLHFGTPGTGMEWPEWEGVRESPRP
jgi:hypothetical protein